MKLLSWLSLAWMTVEGAVAILAAGSIALIGFGLDSAIEGFASVIVIWRFTGRRVFSHAAKERAQKLVAIQFFVLAPYVGVEAVRGLVGGERPDTSLVGILLAIGSLVFMPMLGIAKQRLADQLGSAATKGEGRRNMLCAYLAGALLVGLLGNALAGAWWLDPIVGLLIAALAVKEGAEAWRGEGLLRCRPVRRRGIRGCVRGRLLRNVSDGYERRIGRHDGELPCALIAVTGVRPGARVLDVGCGSVALTGLLADVVGPANVVGGRPGCRERDNGRRTTAWRPVRHRARRGPAVRRRRVRRGAGAARGLAD